MRRGGAASSLMGDSVRRGAAVSAALGALFDGSARPMATAAVVAASAPSSSNGACCVDRVDAVVIGAGVVGLAVARALALAGREVVILEAEDAIGTHTSSRNSEVIHAGIYYPKGSLKARACVAGRELLYDYCAERGVPHRRCGKLIVATDAAQLERAGRHPAEGARQRRHRRRVGEPGAGARARARAALRRGAVLALDRHHRQPRPDARLPGRRRSARARCSR